MINLQKEDFQLLKEFETMDHPLGARNPVTVLLEYIKAIFLFALLTLRPNTPSFVLCKVHRWTIALSQSDL